MESAKPKSNFFRKYAAPIALGAVMFSTYVGPGFAAGTQTVQYFITKGWMGVFLGPLACGVLAFLMNYLMFEVNRIYKPDNFRQFYDTVYQNRILRFIISNFKELASVMGVIIAITSQVAVVNALALDMWGISRALSTIIYVGLIFFFAIWGAKILRSVGSILTIGILLVCAYVAIWGIPAAWPDTMAFVQSRVSPAARGFTMLGAWYIMFQFNFNFTSGSDAAIPASKGVLNTRKDVIVSCLTNIILCVVGTMIFTIVFAAATPEIYDEAIPTLWAIRNIVGGTRGAQTLYAVLAFSAMISTGVAMLFGFSERWQKPLGKLWKKSGYEIRKAAIALAVCLLATWGSKFGVITIIQYGFIYFGAIMSPIIMYPLFIAIPYRLWKDRKDGKLPKPDGDGEAATTA